MTKLFGALLFTVFLLFCLLLYRREEKRSLAEYRGLCRLVSHIRELLSTAPTPLCEIFAGFKDEALSACGFLPLLQSEGLASALSAGKLHLEKESLSPLSTYAENLGTRLYAEEKRAAEEVCCALQAAFKEKEEAFPRQQKLTGTLFFSGGMLLLLLLL